MAIYGSRSPFKKTEGKESPMKTFGFLAAPGASAAISLGGAVLGAFGKRKARRQAKKSVCWVNKSIRWFTK